MVAMNTRVDFMNSIRLPRQYDFLTRGNLPPRQIAGNARRQLQAARNRRKGNHARIEGAPTDSCTP
jgi:hypothetical protein